MDTLSHGLWGGVTVGRNSRSAYWTAFAFGVAPDLLAFGPFFVGTLLGVYERPIIPAGGHPRESNLPVYVHTVYQYTHSLVIFALAFGLVWWIRARRRPAGGVARLVAQGPRSLAGLKAWWALYGDRALWPMGAWGLHILMDIPTHSSSFFPTPFLWPVSDFTVNGIPWSAPYIFFPNVVGLLIVYAVWWWHKRRTRMHKLLEY